MPNASDRFTDTAISAMNSMLFTLNCFNYSSNIDTKNHPRLIVIFNDVSLYGNDYDPYSIE